MTRRRDFTGWWRVERVILDCLNEHAWHTPTARVTIKHLAELAECSERHINGAPKRMRERGDIDWTTARAPGARYEHCVYTIHENYWKPPSHAARAKTLGPPRDQGSGRPRPARD